MKTISLKLTLALLTFFIGIGIVCLWYYSRACCDSEDALTAEVLSAQLVVENPCDYPQPINKKLNEDEVVHRAECFIIQNGYTDLPPVADKSKLTPESVWGLTDEFGMKLRHDTLERKAYSIQRDDYYDGGWQIMFLYKPRDGKDVPVNAGRAVIMDSYGGKITIRHTAQPLNMPGAKILNR